MKAAGAIDRRARSDRSGQDRGARVLSGFASRWGVEPNADWFPRRALRGVWIQSRPAQARRPGPGEPEGVGTGAVRALVGPVELGIDAPQPVHVERRGGRLIEIQKSQLRQVPSRVQQSVQPALIEIRRVGDEVPRSRPLDGPGGDEVRRFRPVQVLARDPVNLGADRIPAPFIPGWIRPDEFRGAREVDAIDTREADLDRPRFQARGRSLRNR